jgi:hypothetical protein
MAKKSITTEVNYGPLKGLIGVWKGNKGMDVSPEKVGSEKTAFYETITFEAAGNLKNAGIQEIVMVRYHLVVTKKSNDEVFHDQIGYWLWDAAAKTVMHSFTIPRGVCVLAGGKYKSSSKNTTLDVKASLKDKNWGIIQSPFMSEKASTLEFKQIMKVSVKKLEYSETKILKIYGRKFKHTDKNKLTRVK